MITVITWLWGTTGWRKDLSKKDNNLYTAEHVNALQRMVKANLLIPHEFKCFTDMPEGINCETFPLEFVPTTNTHPTRPNCYRRLAAFREEMRPLVGDRFVSLDLDCVILGDITSIIDRPKDQFIILEGSAAPYNGSMWMMDTGCRKQVYTHFHPIESPNVAAAQVMANGRRYHGSDQAWISYKIPGEKTWGKKDGIYQYVYDIKNKPMPENAKIVFYAGEEKPWSNPGGATLHKIYNDYAA